MQGCRIGYSISALQFAKYTHKNYELATAITIVEIMHLVQSGFQKSDEVNGIHVYRRPRKYNS
jgi:hypothetical protein